MEQASQVELLNDSDKDALGSNEDICETTLR